MKIKEVKLGKTYLSIDVQKWIMSDKETYSDQRHISFETEGSHTISGGMI